MSTDTDTLERILREDLASLGDRLVDEEFSTELYRALGGRVWRKDNLPGRISLSWSRAEDLVNELRDERGRPALTLAQTGGEGELSPAVEEELGRLGWRSEPLNTDRHDPTHEWQPAEREPRTPPNAEWEREAHEEASETVRRGR
jgi:hypothetical protein